jgi:hypothetical protein
MEEVLMVMMKKSLEQSDNEEEVGYILIDPPVGPYSSDKAIKEWITELEMYPDRPEVQEAIREAREWL